MRQPLLSIATALSIVLGLACASGPSKEDTGPLPLLEMTLSGTHNGQSFSQTCHAVRDAGAPGEAEADCSLGEIRCETALEDGTELTVGLNANLGLAEPDTFDYAMCQEACTGGVFVIVDGDVYTNWSNEAAGAHAESTVNQIEVLEIEPDAFVHLRFEGVWSREDTDNPLDMQVSGELTLDCASSATDSQ